MRRTFTVSREVTLGPDEERRRLLRDLHDSVGPTLAAAALGVHSARNLLHQDRAAAERVLVRIEEELHSAIAEIRRLAREVRTPVLDRLGLVDAIRHYAETLNSRVSTAGHGGGRLRIDVDVCEGLPALPAAVELAAYRIVCEALTNVAKHSHARSCVVRIRFDGDLQLEIADDGIGVIISREVADLIGEADEADEAGGVGLGSMRERARSLGGDLAVEPALLGGTRVAATLPVGTG